MSDPIIQVRHLTKVFGEGESAVHALDDISLDVHPGEIYGIIGLSGAGKSTLVRCLNLLERPTSGSVLVDGKEMTKLSDKELRLARRNVTMIFQSFNLLMQRTCLKTAGQRAAGDRRPFRQGGGLPRPALRRPEAAYCHCKSAGHRPQGPPL